MRPTGATEIPIERALVTGVGGFAGHHLARALQQAGVEVFGYTLAEGPPAPDGVSTVYGDIRSTDTLEAAVAAARPQAVFHLAAVAAVGAAWSRRLQVLEINALGTNACLQAVATQAPTARVVLISSGEVYGHVAAADLPVREDHPLQPRNPYATSKACAEIIATEFGASQSVDLVTVRPFNFAGPGQEVGFVCSDFARQVARAEAGLTPPVIQVGNLSAERDFTDVRDLVAGLVAAAERGRAGRAYNLCTGTPVTIQSVLDHFIESATIPIEVKHDPSRTRPADVPRFVGDPGQAGRELDWRATIPFRQTLSDTLEWWRERGRERRDVD